jgi:hypothetical protein
MDTVRVASSAFDGADSGDATAQRASARDTILRACVIIVVDGWDGRALQSVPENGEDDDTGDDDARGVRDNVDDGRRGVTRRAQQTRTGWNTTHD